MPQGDYGYKSLYGGGGNHPFQAWGGDLPGTLPYIDGTGEAPSGLLDCARAALPMDFSGNLLVTIWNENTINRYVTQRRGVSLTATNSVLVSGGQDFRPVALDADSRGNIFITDWVLVDYPNHGRGRIWRLSPKPNQPVIRPRPYHAVPKTDTAFEPFKEILSAGSASDLAKLEAAFRSDDAFLRHAAVVALSNPIFRERALDASNDSDFRLRLGALLALRRAKTDESEQLLRTLLRDTHSEIRRMALVWAGEQRFTNLREDLDQAVAGPDTSAALFETYLAAVENLSPPFVETFRDRAKDKSSQLTRKLPPGLLESIIRDEGRSARVRALAIPRLENQDRDGSYQLLAQLLRYHDGALQREAIRSLGRSSHENAVEDFRNLVAFLEALK